MIQSKLHAAMLQEHQGIALADLNAMLGQLGHTWKHL